MWAMILAALATGGGARRSAAQVANASTAALGMAGNYTAAATGYTTVYWNPALLGMPGSRHLSATLFTPGVSHGVTPVSLGDLADYSGELVPDAVKLDWLQRIQAQDGQSGIAGGDVVWGALQVGRFAVQASTSARGTLSLSPGVAELVLFGNVDGNGTPQNLDLSGSVLEGSAYSTIAASYAQPWRLAGGTATLSLGATVTYTVGHVLIDGSRSTGVATADPLGIGLDFPVVYSEQLDADGNHTLNEGNGVGLDLGAAYRSGSLTVSAAVQNVFNTFSWDLSTLRYRPVSLTFTGSSHQTDTEQQPLSTAPAELRNRIADLSFKPGFTLGGALRHGEALLVTADFQVRSKTGIITGPDTHLGAGLEYRPAPWFPLRAGAALISMGDNNSGYQLGGGLGFDLGGWNLAFSAGLRHTDRYGSDTLLMLTLLSVGLQ